MHAVEALGRLQHEVLVFKGQAFHPGGVVHGVFVGEAHRQQAVVLGRTCGALQHIGGRSGHVDGHQFVNLDFVLFHDVRVVGFVGAQASFVYTHQESPLLPLAAVPKRVPVLVGDHFNPCASGGVSRRELVSCFVAHSHLDLALVTGPFCIVHHKVHRLVAQHVSRPCDGAVEMGFRGGQAQRIDVVAHDFEHLHIASDQQVLAEGLTRLQEQVARADHHALVDLGHVTVLAFGGRLSVVGVC